MHIASAVYFHFFSDALNAKKKKEEAKKQYIVFSWHRRCEHMKQSYCVLKLSQGLECHKNTGLLLYAAQQRQFL